tara:strand:+ start:185 stop:2305 length:2121 start_codon:yes stop_codon:yes gene_type:complete
MPLTKVSSRAIEDTLRYVLGANGTSDYTFTGPGLSGAVNDPTLTLSRGHTYIFENRSGGHPFYIKTSIANGGTNDAYNTGVTNNGGGNGTEIIFTVPHDAPDLLYYQCSSHSSMAGQLKIAGAVADGSITNAKLASDSVGTNKIIDGSVGTNELADDAVTSAKIADNPSFSGTSGIKLPVGTTAQRVNTEALLRYNSELDLPEYYNGTDYVVIDSPPNITSVSPTEVESAAGGNITFTINGSRFSVGATVKFVSNTGTEITASTVTRVSSSQLTAVVAKSSFVNAQEPYDVKVTNSSGLAAVLEDQINVDNAPAWVTSSGSLGSFGSYNTFSVTVSATDPEGDTISYSIVSGSLPSGVTLNSSSGVISGSVGVSSPTTYSFTLRATAGGKTADRAFSFTVNLAARAYNYTGSVQTWTKPTGLTAVTAIIWGAGGGGGGDTSGDGGGSGGYSQAIIDMSSMNALYLVVGQGGDGGSAYDANTTNNWMEGGGGGGLSGIFDDSSFSQGDSILIAGSGGGGGGADSQIAANGGYGGGANSSGGDGDDDTRGPGGNSGGDGGSTSSGGAAGSNSSAGSYQAAAPTAGSALEGGRAAKQSGNSTNLRGQAYYQGGNIYQGNGSGLYMSGSGGSGYYGGGGGNCGYAGGGGGGSGYAKSSVTSSVSGTDGNKGNSDNGGAAPQSGSSYYSAGIGKGGDKNSNGGNGMIILIY